ncbi:MAG: type II toxin-antitoxin system RelE/ParE family toxin [Segetibacter sp.]
MKKNYELLFSPKALADIEEARVWYNLQQRGLGKRLILDVKNVIAFIKRNPYFASVKFESIRTAACNTFPYAVHYEIDEDQNVVKLFLYFILAEDLIGKTNSNLDDKYKSSALLVPEFSLTQIDHFRLFFRGTRWLSSKGGISNFLF